MEATKVYSAVRGLGVQQSQYSRLFQTVSKSGALNNKFFDKCKENALSKETLVLYLFNWYVITESFAVYGLLYAHHVAKYLQKNIESENFEDVESFFCKVLNISKGEFEIINEAPSNFHPKAFTRLAPKLGVGVRDLILRKHSLNPETIVLEKNILANFSNGDDILCGFANFFVVETIAYNIVISMKNTFGELLKSDGSKLYNDYEMTYIDRHIELELKHSDEVVKMLEELSLTESKFSVLQTYVQELSLNFSKFWEALSFKDSET